MKPFALLGGTFLVTFALLISVWMIGTGRSPFGGLAATPSPAPTQAPTAAPTEGSTLTPTASPTPTAVPSPTASPTPSPTAPPLATPSPSPAPLRTPPPSGEPLPSGQPGSTTTYTMTGAQFTSYQMTDHARLVRKGDALTLVTTSDSPDALWVTYTLDPPLLPAGAVVRSVDADVCGAGSGTFWEAYGPTGSDPNEYEVVPPDADGCWHFRNAATSDISVVVSTMLESQMTIQQIVFRVTFDQ
jgi:hypothetical protein